ncbi:hypothetical protein C8P68_101772 [Mucilaginibacter yixingensis]|uniref:Fibronectin type-III domain-containing protein n=1 Tax=Mucilaginibacter yixingensis TaxID=1295612 RepID=A0A2T5JGJ0_9SPHI|nr:hypothetical protein [Mucilaginibacter yixingensis]PTR01538.1 hypothetical protein C8P68_101772 [Mucilaginibacter yixingensis]
MRKLLICMLATLLFAACSSKKDDTQNVAALAPPPEKSNLLLPIANSVCTTGTVISTTQSSIAFSWTAATNAESYDIVIKNLITNTTAQQTTVSPQVQITLDRNAPYSWYVVSKSSKTTTTAQSDVFKFYSAGLGIVYYAPFPADAVSPEYGVTVSGQTTNLIWKGTSTDNNIVGYDVYFGTIASPPLFKSNVTDVFLNNIPLSTGTLYYWRIVTKDANGNTSSSDTFQFKTK